MCPREVVTEWLHPGAPPLVREWAGSLPEWIEVMDAPHWADAELDRLDVGEAAAIRLACDHDADLLLIDERLGRQVAVRLGVRVAGVLAVLADAAQAGLIDFETMVHSLIKGTNFRVSDRVLALVRARLSDA